MCEFNSGRLILSHHRSDDAAQQVVEILRGRPTVGIRHVSAMDHLIHASGGSTRAKYEYHLLEAPAGAEMWAVDQLQALYHQVLPGSHWGSNRRPPSDFIANHSDMMVSVDSAVGLAQSNASFQLDQVHATYKNLVGLTTATSSTGFGTTIAVIDSGLDPNAGITASATSRSFHDQSATSNIDDDNGHGTAVASIIHDIAPGAELQILKIGDGNPLSEWNLAAGLIYSASADVVNISVAFGLGFRNCAKCGRGQTQSSRSAVFERLIQDVLINSNTIYVVAAGNRSQALVDYPARFADMIAVGAVDSQVQVPAFSNTGATAHDGNPHQLLFFAPGGGNGEHVGQTTRNGKTTDHEGTSFAAPYVSALVALFLESQGMPTLSRSSILSHFTQSASQSISGYAAGTHGNGLIQA